MAAPPRIKQVSQSAQIELERAHGVHTDFRAVQQTPEGRRVLDHIMNQICGLNAATLLGDTPQKTAHMVGRRDVGVEILRTIEGHKFQTK